MRMKKARIEKGECFFVHLCGIKREKQKNLRKK